MQTWPVFEYLWIQTKPSIKDLRIDTEPSENGYCLKLIGKHDKFPQYDYTYEDFKIRFGVTVRINKNGIKLLGVYFGPKTKRAGGYDGYDFRPIDGGTCYKFDDEYYRIPFAELDLAFKNLIGDHSLQTLIPQDFSFCEN